jgi:hypothetical protein
VAVVAVPLVMLLEPTALVDRLYMAVGVVVLALKTQHLAPAQEGHQHLEGLVVRGPTTQTTQPLEPNLVVAAVALKLVTPVLAATGVLSSRCGK